MNWKEFFKPTILKILLLIVFMLVSMFYEYSGPLVTDTSTVKRGLPFSYYSKSSCGDPCVTADDIAAGITVKITENFNYVNVFFNLIILYLLSAGFVYGFERFKK